MSDFEPLIENYLADLRSGKAVEVSWGGQSWLVADASIQAPLQPEVLENLSRRARLRPPVLLMADERQFLELVSAYDLDDTARLERGDCLPMSGLLGIREDWLSADYSAPCSMVQDRLLFTLIKRLRQPLVAFKPEPVPDQQGTDAYA
ncbi:MAG TPA: hypothetical protein VIK80_09290 [Flavihumibacter sp.]